MKNKDILNCLDYNKIGLKVLLIAGSPRAEKRSRSHFLFQETLKSIEGIEGVDLLTYSFTRKQIRPYRESVNEIAEGKDDFPELLEKWLAADAVIWSVPVYHMGPPSLVRAAMNRLSAEVLESSKANGHAHLPRYSKVVGGIIQGGSRFGGQEIAMLYMMQHTYQMRCIWVSADMHISYHGVAVHTTTDEALKADTDNIEQCQILARRVIETARFVKAGLMLTRDSLPDEYFPSRKEAGEIDRVAVLS
jgi:multimeric flavodoxin WrbA